MDAIPSNVQLEVLFSRCESVLHTTSSFEFFVNQIGRFFSIVSFVLLPKVDGL